MICEFALEPALVATWHDRKQFLFFDEKFGIATRRFNSAYPKSWIKLVWAAFEAGPARHGDLAYKRMTEIVQHLKQYAVRRPSTFPEIHDWLQRAEHEHGQRPFRAIIALGNPRNQPFVITAETLIQQGHELWVVPEIETTPRTAQQIASAVSSLTRLCRQLVIIDPYFEPSQPRFAQPLKAVLASCHDNIGGMGCLQVELHTCIDRRFKSWEKGEDRNPAEEAKAFADLSRQCQAGLPRLLPSGMTLKVVVWKQRPKGEKLHNRYLLTDLFSVMFGTGVDQADDPADQETDDITPLTESQHQTRRNQYTGVSPAFDLVGVPLIINGIG